MRNAVTLLTAVALIGCGSPESAETGAEPETAANSEVASSPHDEFMERLQSLCGQAFEGALAEGSPADSIFDARLVMHVRECSEDEVRIPFHVGDDRSRTWIVTRTAEGLRLKHDHRHEDGTEDEVTMYGGDTRGDGTAATQEFHADQHTADLIPAAATNVWTMEVDPERNFAYALRREGTDRRVRIEFDLTRPVEAPPAPWGHD